MIARLCVFDAGVAELADALDLGSSGATREGSNPFARTIIRMAEKQENVRPHGREAGAGGANRTSTRHWRKR